MERLTTYKNVENYSELSKYYDELLQDEEALDLWLKYIEAEKFNSVLELASGSGVMAKTLANKGYDITASDISFSMRDVSKKNFKGKYLILNMSNYNLNNKFDLILCICDSFNYLNNNELKSFFNCAYNHLKQNGRLIFDMHSYNRLNEFKEQYIEEGKICDIPYQWTILSDIYDNTLNEHFTFYTKNAIIQEHHTQFIYTIDEICGEMNGLFEYDVIKDFVKDEKVLFIGRKK